MYGRFMMKRKCLLFLTFWTLLVVFLGFSWYLQQHNHQHSSVFHISTPNKESDTSQKGTVFVDQLIKYCNLPFPDNFRGLEGDIDNSYDLLGVIAIFRHGDRGPLSPVNAKREINCSYHVTDRYKQLENYVRMYKSEPLGVKLLPKSDFCGPGLLSKQGASQLIELGHGFKQSYSKYLNFSNFNSVKHVSANTTPYSRTIQSLYSFLFGLVGSKTFLNITLQKTNDVSFCFKHCRCEAANRFEKLHKIELNKHMGSDFSLANFSSEVKLVLKDFEKSKKTILPSTLKDMMLQYVCHNQILECSGDDPVCLNSTTMIPLDHYLQREAQASANGLNLRKASLLRAHGLLNNIDQQIHSWINVSKKRKPTSLLSLPNFHFFSGHDLTLMYILVSLRIYDGYLPQYASRITFEILSKRNQYYVRILWNGADVTKQTCPTSLTYCNARFIATHLRNEMKRYFQTDKFLEACEI